MARVIGQVAFILFSSSWHKINQILQATLVPNFARENAHEKYSLFETMSPLEYNGIQFQSGILIPVIKSICD